MKQILVGTYRKLWAGGVIDNISHSKKDHKMTVWKSIQKTASKSGVDFKEDRRSFPIGKADGTGALTG